MFPRHACENMPEMLRGGLKDGTLSFNRCHAAPYTT
jgi:hypothetical protein